MAENRNGDTDMSLLPELMGFNLRCAQVAVFQHFNRTLGTRDISPPQLGALVLISANPGISQSAVAGALRFDRSTLVQIIDRLEDRGLVVREVSPTDRRSHALQMTESGAVLLEELKVLTASHEDHMARRLSAEERRTLIRLLQGVYNTDG